MDFLNPAKQRRHALLLVVGYVLIGVALIIGTVVLLYQAYGFGLGKNGKVVQSGLVFVASTPSGAAVSVNGAASKAQTNARLSLVSGNYTVSYSRSGYRPWQRSFTLSGGSIERLDYAFLFPTKLTTTTIKSYDAPAGLATQSPDKRRLLVQEPGSDTEFDVFDLKDTTLAPTKLSIPTTLLTSGTNDSWALDEWSNDNVHVLLSHIYDGKTEFILIDRTDASKSVNLNNLLGVGASKISLVNKKFDQYYVYDAAAQTLQTATINDPTPKTYLSNVLAYQSYGSNDMLYASSKTATEGKVGIVLLMGSKSYFLREVSGGTDYLLDLTQYAGDWYVAIGASSENKVYVYKNPDAQLNSSLGLLVPVSVLKTPAPKYLAFSSNARYIMDENGSQFSVYDAEVDKAYQYDTKLPLDVPQPHASWMDGNRLTYVSGGKLVVFDFDHANTQTLMAASPSYLPFFMPDYKHVAAITPAVSGAGQDLTSTTLRTPTDL